MKEKHPVDGKCFLIVYILCSHLYSSVLRPAEALELRGVMDTLDEVAVRLLGVEDWHALEGVDVALAADAAVLDGEGGLVAGFAHELGDVKVVGAGRVGHVLDLVAELGFGLLLRLDELGAQLVVRQVSHRLVVDGVRGDGHAVLLHLAALVPGQVALARAEEARDDEDRTLEAILLEDWVGIVVIVLIAVVEGDQHGLIGQRPRALDGIVELVGRDGVVAMLLEVAHLPVKVGRRDGERQEFVADLVVVEHEDLRAIFARVGLRLLHLTRRLRAIGSPCHLGLVQRRPQQCHRRQADYRCQYYQSQQTP